MDRFYPRDSKDLATRPWRQAWSNFFYDFFIFCVQCKVRFLSCLFQPRSIASWRSSFSIPGSKMSSAYLDAKILLSLSYSWHSQYSCHCYLRSRKYNAYLHRACFRSQILESKFLMVLPMKTPSKCQPILFMNSAE